MQNDMFKEAEGILNEGKDTKDYKVLFILEPILKLDDSFYERACMEEYMDHEPVSFAAKSSDEITSIDILDQRTDYITPWTFSLGDDFMKLLKMRYQITNHDSRERIS